jgi:hypothetical protein
MEKHQKFLVIAWIICITYLVLSQVIKRYQKFMSSVSIAFQQALLPNYFSALKLNHIEEFIECELAVREYGFNILDDEALEKMEA